jgi:hypothetical protein
MFLVDLPYSKEKFVIPVITFRDIFTLARLSYDKNNEGYIATLDEMFKFKHLNVVDKFFVLLKAKQYFINENISLNTGEKTVNVSLANFTKNLYDITNKYKVIKYGNYTIELDIPCKFVTQTKIGDIYDNIIKSVSIGSQKIELRDCDSRSIQELLEILPSALITHLKQFISDTSHNVVLFSSGDTGNNIGINFITAQPYEFISLLFSENDLNSCRELLFSLSDRMGSDALMNSTLTDISFYLTLYNDEIKRKNSSGNPGLAL